MSTDLTTRIIREPSQLAPLADEWIELWGRSTSATPFQRPEWILSWTEAFSPRNLVAIEVRDGSALVGLAPLLIYPRSNEWVLAFMAGGISDYLDLLVAPERKNEIVTALIDAMKKIQGWTILDLTDVPADSIVHRTMPSESIAPHDNCSTLHLPESSTALLQVLSKRQRANLRNAHSRLERAGGAQVELATAETVLEFVDDLFRLHTNRWSLLGEAGVLAGERIKAFHCASGPPLVKAGILRLYRMRLKDRTIAALYTFWCRSRVFCYLQGFDPEFASLGPGTQLIFWAMQDAINSGMRKFDFLRGEEAYKLHWRAQAEPTYRLQLPRTSERFSRVLHESAA